MPFNPDLAHHCLRPEKDESGRPFQSRISQSVLGEELLARWWDDCGSDAGGGRIVPREHRKFPAGHGCVEDSGIPASRIKVMGYGASRPLMLNTGDGNRAINRRLELYFHRPDADIGL